MPGIRIRALIASIRECGGRGRRPANRLIERVDRPALVSVAVAGIFVFVGVVRLLSYYRSGAGYWIKESVLGFLAYQPESEFNVRYFKILASLAAIGFIYFLFRFFNRAHRNVFPPGYPARRRDLDFKSPGSRLLLLAIVNLQWTIDELYKFSTESYPYSPLESWESNVVVLALSSLIAFVGMKYLSFGPVLRERAVKLRRLDTLAFHGVKSQSDI